MKHLRNLIYMAAFAMLLCSCGLGDTASDLFSGETVARVGKHRLHRSELEKFIPHGVSPEDSTALARQYINAWAEELLMLDMAQEQLSPEEKDVSEELEEYRRTLLKYRYGELYINSRLDTLVTDEEIAQYYKANQDKFRLDRPVIKSRYMIIPGDSRNLKTFRKLMSSEDDNDIRQADSLAVMAAIKYVDSSDTWMDAITLAQELGTDYRTLLQSIKNSFAEVTDESGILHLAFIVEMVPEGRPAPLDYCSTRIRDIILSTRKHNLETALERDLLEDAVRNNKFEIYEK